MEAAAWISVAGAVISLLAVAAATLQVRHARTQANEARRQADAAVRQTDLQEQIHRDTSQPYVWADFRMDATQGALLQLVVRNEGPSVARHVRILFEPQLQGAGLQTELGAIQERLASGLESLPPGRQMAWTFGIGHILFDEATLVPLTYQVTIDCEGPNGPVTPLSYVLDLNEYRHSAAPRLGSLNDIAKAIRDLKE